MKNFNPTFNSPARDSHGCIYILIWLKVIYS